MFSKIKRVLERMDKMSSAAIINEGGWEPNDLNIDFREFREYVFERNVIKNRIDNYDLNIDFREYREYVSYSNNFLEHMSLDELR